MVTDKGAFTLYVDRVRAVNSKSKIYLPLSPDFWQVVKGSTPLFKLTSSGLDTVGADTEIRLTGLAAPDVLSDDTTDCDIDPSYVIAAVTGTLLVSHAKSSRLDIKDREALGKIWLEKAKELRQGLQIKFTSILGTTIP